jgi:diguanylate cyclase
MGVEIALDDFGTGHSSLGYLKRFPIDVVKIDGSFVEDVADDPTDAAVVRAIIAMAHSLGMRVVAEGVETQQQLDFLRRPAVHDPGLVDRCDEFQGFLFSRPAPADEVSRILAGEEAGARAGPQPKTQNPKLKTQT